jgi:iron complex transport system substrate-binding protein
MRDIDDISGEVLDVALRLHRDLGPGLLESVYETLLAQRLQDDGLFVERQKAISAEFESVRFEVAFRADLVVEGRLLVEVKSVDRLMPVHSKPSGCC